MNITLARSNTIQTAETGADNLCRSTIFASSPEEYGPDYRDHFFEQYRLFTDTVNYTSELKLKINTFFLTLNSGLVTAIGISFTRQTINPYVWHDLLPVAGLVICLIWWGIIYSYKQRNVIKLRIIHCLEDQLPLALYRTEWNLMEENHGSWLKKFLFRVDLVTPYVFAFSYLLFTLIA